MGVLGGFGAWGAGCGCMVVVGEAGGIMSDPGLAPDCHNVL